VIAKSISEDVMQFLVVFEQKRARTEEHTTTHLVGIVAVFPEKLESSPTRGRTTTPSLSGEVVLRSQ
jgi:hypothetical protein